MSRGTVTLVARDRPLRLTRPPGNQAPQPHPASASASADRSDGDTMLSFGSASSALPQHQEVLDRLRRTSAQLDTLQRRLAFERVYEEGRWKNGADSASCSRSVAWRDFDAPFCHTVTRDPLSSVTQTSARARRDCTPPPSSSDVRAVYCTHACGARPLIPRASVATVFELGMATGATRLSRCARQHSLSTFTRRRA